MYLMYYENEDGSRVYTLQARRARIESPQPPPMMIYALLIILALSRLRAQKMDPKGNPTKSAHPARFSPDDKFSRERVTLKKRFNILPTQLPAHEM